MNKIVIVTDIIMKFAVIYILTKEMTWWGFEPQTFGYRYSNNYSGSMVDYYRLSTLEDPHTEYVY